MPLVKRVKFLLVFVDTFSGWMEAFLTTNKQVPTVARLILTEILPRFGMPSSLQSDNRPEFTSQMTQNIARALQVPWRFHIPYHPRSSHEVERANWVLKVTLTKLTIELHQDWTKPLPLALLKVWALPKKKKNVNISPFKAMYGRPILPVGCPLSWDGPKLPSHLPFPLLAQIQHMDVWQHMDDLLQRPHPNFPYPSLQIGDKVYMTIQPHSDLTPKWQGSYTVILLTPTAAKLKEITLWVHITHLKKVVQPNDENACRTNTYQVSHTAPTTLKFSQLLLAPNGDRWACWFHGYSYSWNNFWQISGSRVLKDPHLNTLKITSPPCGYREPFITFTPSWTTHFYHLLTFGPCLLNLFQGFLQDWIRALSLDQVKTVLLLETLMARIENQHYRP